MDCETLSKLSAGSLKMTSPAFLLRMNASAVTYNRKMLLVWQQDPAYLGDTTGKRVGSVLPCVLDSNAVRSV